MRIARGAVELGLLGVERFLQLADFLFVFRGALVIPALRRPRLFAGLRMAALQLDVYKRQMRSSGLLKFSLDSDAFAIDSSLSMPPIW